MKQEYIVVSSDNLKEGTFEEVVSCYLNDGWKLAGSMSVVRGEYDKPYALFQPMVRMVPDIKGTQAEGLGEILK